jgi:nucleoside-diphosphate-sugar epimerase
MKKILVVGGAGYVGGITSDLLIKAGHQVTVFDRLLYEDRFLKDINFIYGDIRNTAQLESIHKDYDTIIWLAGIVGDGACSQDVELTHEVNFYSIKRFLEKTKRELIFPSTCSVYGAQNEILNETSSTNPLSAYASSKLMAEKEVLKFGGTVFRLGTLFGLGDSFSRIRLDLVINLLTYKSLFEKEITVFGGEQWRPVLSVEDVGHYFVEATKKPVNDVFVISKQNIKIIDVGNIFTKIFPDIKMNVTEISFEDARNYKVTTEKADSYFSHRPIKTFEGEIERMAQVLSSHRIKDPLDPIYYNTNYVKKTLEDIKIFQQP